MNFTFIDKDEEQDYYYWVYSDKDDLCVGIYPVLFGFRIRVWDKGDKYGCLADLCCGAEVGSVKLVFSAVLNFLEKGGSVKNIPRQYKRPFPKAEPFDAWVYQELEQELPHSLINITVDDLAEMKEDQMKRV